jgi:hypothetical protein
VNQTRPAEARLVEVFFGAPRTHNLGGGILVMMCRLCEQWVSPERIGSHLMLMHEFLPTEAQIKQVETMHSLGADIRDIASAVGARV